MLLDLAQQLVRDGEGATKFVKITITGAASPASARKIARTVAESPLVKTAIAGEDANWGRIVMAVGRADEPVNRDRIAIRFGDLVRRPRRRRLARLRRGQDERLHEEAGARDRASTSASAAASAVMWTCDLTKRYVEINGDYRSLIASLWREGPCR